MVKEILCYLIAGFWIPLIPIFILYKVLKSTSEISGSPKLLTYFNDFKIQATGAVAGYFIMMACAFYFINIWFNPFVFEAYNVEGKMQLPPNCTTEGFDLYMKPVNWNLNPNGNFSYTIFIRNDQLDSAQFPNLVIENSQFQTEAIDLRKDENNPYAHPYHITHDKENKKILIKDQISLHKNDEGPDYVPTQTPQPIN